MVFSSNQNVRVVAFPNKQLTREELINCVKRSVVALPERPLIVVFSEAILGENPVSRAEGKKLAGEINSILVGHKNAYVFFSLFEKGASARKEIFSNTGYVITPSKEKKWLVYPKVSYWDYRQKLTNMDNRVLKNNSMVFPESEMHWVARSNKIPSFPRINISGKKVEFRVCADCFQPWEIKGLKVNSAVDRNDLVIISASGINSATVQTVSQTFFNKGSSVTNVLMVDGTDGEIKLFTQPKSRKEFARSGSVDFQWYGDNFRINRGALSTNGFSIGRGELNSIPVRDMEASRWYYRRKMRVLRAHSEKRLASTKQVVAKPAGRLERFFKTFLRRRAS